MSKLKIYKMYADVQNPSYATTSSACFDIRAYFGTETRLFKVYDINNAEQKYMAFQYVPEDAYHTILNPGDRALIPTGLKFDIPDGYSVRIHPRSGLALKQGLTLSNAEGVIDADYVEPVYVCVRNDSNKQIKITHGDRIAQAELVYNTPTELEFTLEEPKTKTNRTGGLGSTGVV